MATATRISDTDIRRRAFFIYQSRRGASGTDLDDWLQAERELRRDISGGEGTEPAMFPSGDWLFAQRARANLLLSGIHNLDEIAGLLSEYPDEPATIWRPGEPLLLPPADQAGTLVLHHVDALTTPEQEVLLDWLVRTAGRVRVISTTEGALLPLVESGAFRSTLYYRLNIVCSE